MIRINLSMSQEIKHIVGRFLTDQFLFLFLTSILIWLRPFEAKNLLIIGVLISINCIFILTPFFMQLIQIHNISYCLYDSTHKHIKVHTARWKTTITPDEYLSLTVRQVHNTYFIYKGVHGNIIPRKCLIVTEDGYNTWKSIYSDIIS